MVEKKTDIEKFTDVRTLDALQWSLNFIRENDLKIYQCSDLIENIHKRSFRKRNPEAKFRINWGEETFYRRGPRKMGSSCLPKVPHF